jgi:hypothetical protein
MTLKTAHFSPVSISVSQVPPVEFSKLYNLVEAFHQHPDIYQTNMSGNLKGGTQLQIYPCAIDLDIPWLLSWITGMCQEYMDIITAQSEVNDLTYCHPVITNISTIRQWSGGYQAMHTHVGNISGNIYISMPDINHTHDTDGQIEFRMPTTKDIGKFIMTDTWRTMPEPAACVIFPSYIPHTVYPWTGAGHRTVVSFDAILVANTTDF